MIRPTARLALLATLFLSGLSGAAVATPAAAAPWARVLGGEGREFASALAAGPAGSVWVGGHFLGGTEIGTIDLAGAGTSDAFLALLSADGVPTWAARFGGRGADEARAVASGPGGEAYLVGFFSGRADFDPGPATLELESAGASDAFVVRVEPDGRIAWARRFGGTRGDVAQAVAVGADGTVYVGGSFQGAAGDLTAAGRSDGFVAAFDGSGAPLWVRRFGGAGDDEVRALAVGSGGVVAGGRFAGEAGLDSDSGAGPDDGVAGVTSAGGSDAFVLVLGTGGKAERLLRFGGSEDDSVLAAAAAGDRAWVAGRFGGSASTGSGDDGASVTSGGRTDAFVLEVGAAGKAPKVASFGGPGDDFPFGLAADRDGRLWAAGFSQDVPHPGAGRGPGPTESFVLKLDGDLAVAERRRFAGEGGVQVLALALPAAGGGPWTAGVFQGEAELDLGGGARADLARERHERDDEREEMDRDRDGEDEEEWERHEAAEERREHERERERERERRREGEEEEDEGSDAFVAASDG